MFLKTLLLLNIAFCTFNSQFLDDELLGEAQETNSLAGFGFSSDSEDFAKQKCYNVKELTITGLQGVVHLNSQVSTEQLGQEMGINTKIGFQHKLFSAGSKSSYLEQIDENDYNFNFNYYHQIHRKVNVQFNGENLFNNIGKLIYQEGNNPYFNIVCGNSLIQSYTEGASLLFTIQVNFQSKSQKETFALKFKAGVPLIGAMIEIKKSMNQSNFQGDIKIFSKQIGGDPSQITKIFGNSSNLQVCSINNTQACEQLVSQFLQYSANNFSSQIQKNQDGLMQGLISTNGKREFLPISYLGLQEDKFLVNENITKMRKLLHEAYEKNLKVFSAANAVNKFGKYTNQLANNFIEIEEIAQQNMDLILGNSQPANGSQSCYTMPDKCVKIGNQILSSLQNSPKIQSTFLYIQYPPIKLKNIEYYKTNENTCRRVDNIPCESNGYCRWNDKVIDMKCQFINNAFDQLMLTYNDNTKQYEGINTYYQRNPERWQKDKITSDIWTINILFVEFTDEDLLMPTTLEENSITQE